ncbi:MAG TPA: hypothetical protein VFK89_09310 [Actinomycetota bacterium]|nr:hypothetical protein [Actinomycetota bacterium]
MERPENGSGPDESNDLVEDLVDEVQRELDRAGDGADDETRLESLETTRKRLEAELDSSLENGPPGH